MYFAPDHNLLTNDFLLIPPNIHFSFKTGGQSTATHALPNNLHQFAELLSLLEIATSMDERHQHSLGVSTPAVFSSELPLLL